MKKLFLFLLFFSIQNSMLAQSDIGDEEDEQIEFSCQQIDEPKINGGIPRTPPTIPVAYFNRLEHTITFTMPCFYTTIELRIPNTDSTVFSYVMQDGGQVVYLPQSLNGELEIHLHRNNYCFKGTIEL